MTASHQIRTAVAIGKFFQKIRRDQRISLQSIALQSGIPMDLLVKIESGNVLAIKEDAQFIVDVTNRIAKNLHVNLEEFYPSQSHANALNMGYLSLKDGCK